jgi:hypothetical protein
MIIRKSNKRGVSLPVNLFTRLLIYHLLSVPKEPQQKQEEVDEIEI